MATFKVGDDAPQFEGQTSILEHLAEAVDQPRSADEADPIGQLDLLDLLTVNA